MEKNHGAERRKTKTKNATVATTTSRRKDTPSTSSRLAELPIIKTLTAPIDFPENIVKASCRKHKATP